MSITEDHQFEVISKFFMEKGPAIHQFESYEYMVNVQLQKLLDECATLKNETETNKYRASFGQVYVEKASFVDENNIVRAIFPSEARLRNIDYESGVSTDIKEEFWELDEKTGNFEKTNEIVHKKILLFKIPTMVRSSRCNLYGLSEEEIVSHDECINCPGGYFIINGNERVLVCQERLNHNHIYVFPNTNEKYPYAAEIRSISEETGHSVAIHAKINSSLKGAVFSLPYMSKDVSAGAVFKALGFLSDDIIKFISPTTLEEFSLVNRMIRESASYTNKTMAIKYISLSTLKADDDEARRIIYTKQVIENELFPHMGICSNTEKAIFLGDMIHKLFKTALTVSMEKNGLKYSDPRPFDDRDNVSVKRIEAPCVLFSDLLRMNLKRYCDNLKKYLEKRQDIITAISRTNNSITASIHSNCATGNWTAQKNSYCRAGVCQLMSRLTYPATLSHLRRIVIPIAKDGKNAKIRQIDTTQAFFIDLCESPEGKSIGIVKNLALLANITVGCNSVLVREIIENSQYLLPSDNYMEIWTDSQGKVGKVYVNGTLLGLTKNPENFHKELLGNKSRGLFSNNQVSFYHEKEDNEIRVFCDPGRFFRPVFTVGEHNKLNIQPEHLELSWSELLDLDVIRYIDSNEVEQSLTAMDLGELEKFKDNCAYQFCEIHPSAMLGVCSAVIPYPEHNQSPRLIYQSSMLKQALGIPVLSYQKRFDNLVHVLHYPQKPLSTTKFNKILKYDDMLTGCNPIVAIACYGSLMV